MHYFEITPSAGLKKYVKCYWSLEQAATAGSACREPVMPDGSLEIIFNLADPFRRYHPDGSRETQPLAIVAGQMRSSALIEPSGEVRLFGIRFHHAGAYPFFRFPLNELTGHIVPLEQVWGSAARSVEGRINDATNVHERVAIVETALINSLSRTPQIDELAGAAARMITSHRGGLPVEGLAAALGQNPRRLERRFQQRIGVSPKFFSRIIRFQHLLNTVRNGAVADLLGTALAAGYYDQAHLIHEFKEFSGLTPLDFFARERQLSDVFIAA